MRPENIYYHQKDKRCYRKLSRQAMLFSPKAKNTPSFVKIK